MVAFLNTYLSFKYTVQSLTYCSFYSQLYNLIFKENNGKTITVFLFTLFTLRNVVTKWLRSIHPVSNRTARFSTSKKPAPGAPDRIDDIQGDRVEMTCSMAQEWLKKNLSVLVLREFFPRVRVISKLGY